MDFHLKLESEIVKHVPCAEPLSVEPHQSVIEALQRMKANKSGGILVCRDGSLEGIFTERDALRMAGRGESFEQSIGGKMTGNPVTIAPNDSVAKAIQLMSTGGYRRLPVVDSEGSPTGVLKVSHIMRYLVEHFPQSIYNLPPTTREATREREGA